MSPQGFLTVAVCLAVLCTITVVFLKQYMPQYAALVSLGGCVIALLFAVPKLSTLVGELEIFGAQIRDFELSLLIKCVVLTILGRTGADFCRDANQTALAGKVELCGNIAVLLAAMPLFTTVSELIGGLLS